jgi:Ca2+-binding EF-hand superfamily protein
MSGNQVSSSSNNNPQTFAWRLINVDRSLLSVNLEQEGFSDPELLQLRGMFLHHDDDRDGFLTSEQLTVCLQELGFYTRDRFVKKFCLNPTQIKIRGLMAFSFKTDFKTFVKVLAREVYALKNTYQDLTALFDFMDVDKTGYISKNEIRHLLMDIDSNTKLSHEEYTKFMKGISENFESSDNRVGREGDSSIPTSGTTHSSIGNEVIKIEELKRHLLFHLPDTQ